MYVLYFNVPEPYVDVVKKAIFATGAGAFGNYSHCAWQTLGQGQFMPLEGSQAFIGEKHRLSQVPEYKIEIICSDEQISAAVAALKAAHPYEEPSFQVLKCEEGF